MVCTQPYVYLVRRKLNLTSLSNILLIINLMWLGIFLLKATIDRRLVEAASSAMEENDAVDSEQNINVLQVQLLRSPGLSYL